MPDFGRWTSNGGDPSINDVNRVDRFFDALGSTETAYSTDHAEAELAFLFADWRDDVRGAPVTAEVTNRDAIEALNAGLGTRKRSRASLALVGSVAAAALCVGGFGAAVFSSGPGDAFYGIRTTLFGEQQAVRDDAVVLAAQTEMQQVQQLIDNGQWEQAQNKLVALSSTVQSVETPEQKQQLVDQYNQLTVKVVEQDPAATLPPDAPLPTFTDSPLTLLPLPTFQIGDTSTSSTTSTTETTPPSDTTSPSDTSTTATTPTSETTPGPEILLTPPPSSGSESPSSPVTTPPSSTTTPPSTTPPPSPTTTTTRVEVTSVTSIPSVPPTVSVVPSRPSQSAPVPAPAPPPASASVEAPAPVEQPSSTTTAPKPPRVEEPEAVTTTVAPPS